MRDQFAVGTTLETMQYLFKMGLKSPRAEFKPFSVAVTTGSLKVVGQGFPVAVWDWGFVGETPRNALKAICPGLSADVYSRQYNDSIAVPAWEVYRGVMLWTTEAEDRQNTSRLKFVLKFILKEKITE